MWLAALRHGRRSLLIFTLLTGLIAIVWTFALILFGGFSGKIFGLAIKSHDVDRPLVVAAIALLTYRWLGGRFARQRPHGASGMLPLIASGVFAVASAVVCLAVGVVYTARSVGGSDSYGYASQAEGWLRGCLTIKQPWVRAVPWPTADWTFTPLGYNATLRDGSPVIVPSYPPGLPLLMAGAKLLAGEEALFWVVPIAGAILVLATFDLGRRVASPLVGATGSWLVATSPAVFLMAVNPMSDLPAAAAAALAFCSVLASSTCGPLLAGLACGAATLLRPNLIVIAAVVGCVYLPSALRARTRERSERTLLMFAIGVVPSLVLVAGLNNALYGSPFRSGYGELETAFLFSHFWPNVMRYPVWLVESHTPFAAVGAVIAVFPLRRFWPHLPLSKRLAIAAFCSAIWITYLFYEVYEDWWTLRFLLPTWPFIMTGAAAAVVLTTRAASTPVQLTAATLVLLLGVYQLRVAAGRGVFDLWRHEQRYAAVASAVKELTEPDSVIFAMQHSGSVRYYTGRVTARYDILDEHWLDRAVAWLQSRGARVYLLGDEAEIAAMRRRFSGQHTLDRLDDPPVLDYRGSTRVFLIDLSRPLESPPKSTTIAEAQTTGFRSPPPVPLVAPAW
jgi:hypothetical protein